MYADAADLSALFDAGIDGLADRVQASESTDVVAFREKVEQFMDDHGCRGPNEWDIRSHSYDTKPELLYSAIDRLRGPTTPPIRRTARCVGRRTRTGHGRVGQVVARQRRGNGNVPRGDGVGKDVHDRPRALTRLNNIRALHEIRMCFNEFGKRMVAAGHLADYRQIYMLKESELDDYFANPATFKAEVKTRESHR